MNLKTIMTANCLESFHKLRVNLRDCFLHRLTKDPGFLWEILSARISHVRNFRVSLPFQDIGRYFCIVIRNNIFNKLIM